MGTLEIIELQGQHLQWVSTLNFLSHEIKIFEKKLEKLITKHNLKSKNKSIEHFQNQFIIQAYEITKIKNEIRKQEMLVAQKSNKYPLAINEEDLRIHNKIGLKVLEQEYIIKKIKEEFLLFIK